MFPDSCVTYLSGQSELMTQIKTIMGQRPEELDAVVRAALWEDEVWARTRAIRTHDHDGWLVAVLVDDAHDARRPPTSGARGRLSGRGRGRR
jgi:hypothetical protein